MKIITFQRWVHVNGAKEWAPIPGTCQNNPYTECQDVEKIKENIVAQEVCEDVPNEECTDIEREECIEARYLSHHDINIDYFYICRCQTGSVILNIFSNVTMFHNKSAR